MALRSSSVRGRRRSFLAGRHTTPSACHASLRSTFLSTFMLDSFGSSASTRTKARHPLRTEVRLAAEERVEGGRVEGRAVPQLQRRHHAIADRIVGHRVHRDRADVGVAADDRLHRAGREVLAVDPQPVVRPAGEEQPAVGVAVGEVTRPVGAVPEALVRRRLVAVVALEARRRLRLDDLADRLVEVRDPPVVVEDRPRALLARSRGRAPSPSRWRCRARRPASTGRGG